MDYVLSIYPPLYLSFMVQTTWHHMMLQQGMKKQKHLSSVQYSNASEGR